MRTTLTHGLTYTTHKDVPVSVVARTLLANEKLIQEGLALLQDVVDGLEISNVQVSVSELSNASPLKEIFAVAVFLTYQEDLETEVPDLIQKLTGINVPDSADSLVTVLVLIAAVYIISEAVKRLFPGKKIEELKREYRYKIAELATLTNTREDLIEKAIDERYKSKPTKTLTQKVQDFFLPAQIERSVSIDSLTGEGISSDAISEIPTELDYEQLEKRNVYSVEDVLLDIHSSDRDYNKQGWAAVIESISSKRVRTELSPEIQPAMLFGKRFIIGNVDVVEELSEGGEYELKFYHLRSVSNDDPGDVNDESGD